ncbi:hypothetical protein, partial [Burkholderia sp. IT-111MI5]|uniref:hypothetical protein n=1 Tax=Burkholderia sp. IT-111MI5 TaxID=3026439 RepID=UPI0039E1DAA6
IAVLAAVGRRYVDNPHANPVESLCIGWVSVLFSARRITPNALFGGLFARIDRMTWRIRGRRPKVECVVDIQEPTNSKPSALNR